jgi:methyl-accepting chemotaxis protein
MYAVVVWKTAAVRNCIKIRGIVPDFKFPPFRRDGGDKKINEDMGRRLAEISSISNNIHMGVADAVRSLQFEDIVRQLSFSTHDKLQYLTKLVTMLDEGLAALMDKEDDGPGMEDFVQGLRELRAKIEQEKAKFRAGVNEVVEQETMSEGDVELFGEEAH